MIIQPTSYSILPFHSSRPCWSTRSNICGIAIMRVRLWLAAFASYGHLSSAQNPTAPSIRSGRGGFGENPRPASLNGATLARPHVSAVPAPHPSNQGPVVTDRECLASWLAFRVSENAWRASRSSTRAPGAKPQILNTNTQSTNTHSTEYYLTTLGMRTYKSVWVSIATSGSATPYTLCDKMPRLSWLGERNITSTELITVTLTYVTTAWRERNKSSQKAPTDKARSTSHTTPNESKAAANTTIAQSSTRTQKKIKRDIPYPSKPVCTLDTETCDKLWPQAENLEADGDTNLVDSRDTANDLFALYACPIVHQCNLGARDEVVLFYWPKPVSKDVCALDGYGTVQPLSLHPTTARRLKSPKAPFTIVKTAITFRGQELYGPFDNHLSASKFLSTGVIVHSSVMTGNFTFTYPTVYLAHHPVTAAISEFRTLMNDWDAYREELVLTGGVIPLRSEDVSSIYTTFSIEPTGLAFVSSVISGLYQGNTEYEGRPIITRIDFNHLGDPVPASVYFKARSDCWNNATHCATITDDSYRPRLHINSSIWRSILPSTLRCHMPAIVDPPIALPIVEDYEYDEDAQLPHFPVAVSTAVSTPVRNGKNTNDHQNLGAKPADRGGSPYPRPTEGPLRSGGTWGLNGGSSAGRSKQPGNRASGSSGGSGSNRGSDSSLRGNQKPERPGWLGGGNHGVGYYGGSSSNPNNEGVGTGPNGGRRSSRYGGSLFTGVASRDRCPRGWIWVLTLFMSIMFST
jgi:hypothetical protein